MSYRFECLLAGLGLALTACQTTRMDEMILIEAGTFEMGDVFDEGVPMATPVHEVTVSSFLLGRCEVTVEEFAAFVRETDYVTSAECADKLMSECGMGPSPLADDQYTVNLAGRGVWILDRPRDNRFDEAASWRNPQFEQESDHPVTAVSWIDAARFCNWLSRGEGRPVAYDLDTGALRDADGRPTTDVTRVAGYRLPTEAEWEYAAREGGRRVRFGNGRDVARATEINFDASPDDVAHAEKGESRRGTVPVGSYAPNQLGLHDMSGNVWEWCSDFVAPYPSVPQRNPYQADGGEDLRRVARGGPWVGDASWARVSARVGWVAYDRCNNIGFRVARSK